ncbi:MAG: carboxypeptidase-like regulatory domain-containing protein, partial [Bacteroidaceae bacterium]|nr:carboxypeptidase-like regulatory domain-containing protein [Bacteroidaceae bacterium]
MKQFSISIALFSLLAVSGITVPVANAAPASVQAADNITVRGTLVDENGEPVMAAAVVLKGNTSIGTASDLDGNFTISVPGDAVLIIQSLGYETKEVAVNGKANLGTITVNTESLFLDQVVVIGYGTQKKAD